MSAGGRVGSAGLGVVLLVVDGATAVTDVTQSRPEGQVWGAGGQPVCDRKIKTRTLSRPPGRVFTPLRSYEGQWLRGRRLAPQTGRLRSGHSPCVASVIQLARQAAMLGGDELATRKPVTVLLGADA